MSSGKDKYLEVDSILRSLSQKYTTGEYVTRGVDELSAKLGIPYINILESLDRLIEIGLIEKVIVPSFRGHCFNEAATNNLLATKADFEGLQDPDDFEELDAYSLELHKFYRRKTDEKQ